MSRKRVEVRWSDSVSHGRWVDPGTTKGADALGCISVGYLIDESKDAITIAQSMSLTDGEVEEYGHALTIPRAAINGDIRELAA